jgi:hypothetical protein
VGTWGFGVEQDDFVRDVIGEFDDVLKRGGSIDSASDIVLKRFADAVGDSDDGPLLWLALAQAQWTYGEASPAVLSRVTSDLDSGAGLDRWADESPAVLDKRLQRLHSFVDKVQRPNPKPRRFPKLIVRKPIFRAGDCLAIDLGEGRYGAALILVADESEPEYGMNLVATLDYLDTQPPDIDVFRRRPWLRLTHHNYGDELDVVWYQAQGFRAVRDRFTLVASVPIEPGDPKDANVYHSWRFLGNQVLFQREWDARAT